MVAIVLVAIGSCLNGPAHAQSPSESGVPEWEPGVDAAMETFERGDFEQAVERLTALAKTGDVDAQYILGSIYDNAVGVREDQCRALEWYAVAAAQGYARAITRLATLYYLGHCTPRDFDEAARHYRRAANLGFAQGQAGLALVYADSNWERYDPRLALEWAETAWDAGAIGNDRVTVYLAALMGYLYEGVEDIPRDWKKAEEFYLFSARQGLRQAQYFLSRMYLQTGGYYTHLEGLMWLSLAADQGDKQAIKMRTRLFSRFEEWEVEDALEAAGKKLFELAANPQSQIGTAAKWCRAHHPGVVECLQSAFAHHQRCDPHITEGYLDERYITSAAYDLCRRETYDAWNSSSDR